MSSPPEKKKQKTINSPVLTDAFKGFGSFDKDIVTTYDLADAEFNFDELGIPCPILPVSVVEEEELKGLDDNYHTKLQEIKNRDTNDKLCELNSMKDADEC